MPWSPNPLTYQRPSVKGWWVRLHVTATGIPSAETFGALTITRAAINLSPIGIFSAEVIGTPVVSRGSVNIAPLGISSLEAFGTATFTRGAVGVTTAGIASAESLGVPTVSRGTVNIVPSGITSAEAFGTAKITQTVQTTGIPSAEAFGIPTVSFGQTVTVTSISSAEAIGVPTVTRGTVNISPTGIVSAEAFGALQVTQIIQTAGIASTEAFGIPTVTRGPVTISPTGIPTAEAIGSLTISTGVVNLTLTGIPSAEAVGTPTLTRGAVGVTATGIASAEAFGTLTVSRGAVSVLPTGISSAEAFGTAVVSTGNQDVATLVDDFTTQNDVLWDYTNGATIQEGKVLVEGYLPVNKAYKLTDSEMYVKLARDSGLNDTWFYVWDTTQFSDGYFGFRVIAGNLDVVSTSFVRHGDVTYDPAVHKWLRIKEDSGDLIFDTSVDRVTWTNFYTVAHALDLNAVYPELYSVGTGTLFDNMNYPSTEQDIFPVGIASAEAFGTLTISLAVSGQDITATGIPSAETFGTLQVTRGAVNIVPTGIASAEAVGTPTVTTTYGIAGVGIASAEAFGTLTISRGVVSISLTGIASLEAIGTPTVTTGPVGVTLTTGIASAEAFGTPTVTSTYPITATGIASTEAFGTAVLTRGAVNLSPTGISSAEAFGTAVITQPGIMPTVVGSVATANNVVSPSFGFGNYANPTAGDVIVAVVGCGAVTAGAATTIPSGWVNCHPSGGNNRAEADTCQTNMAYHVVTTTEDTNNTLTYTLTNLFSGLQNWSGVAIALRGVNQSTPIDSAVAFFNSANTATPHTFSLLAGADLSTGSIVVGALSNDGGETYASDPAGWTRRGYQANATNSATICETRDAATVAGTDVTATNITPSVGDEYAGFTVAFAAA